MSSALSPIEIFCSYAPEDEPMLHKLEVHLSVLKQQGLIATQHHLKILAGTALDTRPSYGQEPQTRN